jgi:hypothetical protein
MTTPTAADRAKTIEAARVRMRVVRHEQPEQPEPVERPQPPRVINKGEREELAKILTARERVAKSVVEQRAAELLADVEQQLAARYTISDEAWHDLAAAAKAAVMAADAEIAERCRTLGIPEQFRPGLSLGWYDRGENADKKRRAELRRVAETRIDALAKKALVAIHTRSLDGRTLLAAGALESAEARAFLAAMPTVEALMPALDVSALGTLALPGPPQPEGLEDDGLE